MEGNEANELGGILRKYIGLENRMRLLRFAGGILIPPTIIVGIFLWFVMPARLRDVGLVGGMPELGVVPTLFVIIDAGCILGAAHAWARKRGQADLLAGALRALQAPVNITQLSWAIAHYPQHVQRVLEDFVRGGPLPCKVVGDILYPPTT